MLFSGIGDVLGGIIDGSITNCNDAFLTFGLSMVLSGIGYGISYGISKRLSNAKLDKIVGNWGADNRIINNRLRDAGFSMLKTGEIGKKGIQNHFFKHGGFNRITYAVMKDIINYSYDFITEQIF